MSCTLGCVRLCAGTKPANEYERTPVPPHARRGWLSFISIFVGRHTAGTEFSIGPLFVARGADPLGILLGLALGNVLAVLSWRFITTPIACRQRLTSFAAFERVVGRRVIVVYDLLAATSLALCCGAMFTVSGTAVGVLLHVDGMPGLEDWTPTSAAFCGAVLASGVVTTCISAFGMRGVSSFSTVTGPFLVAAVLFMGFRSLQLLGVDGIGNLWSVLNEKVWTGNVVEDRNNFTRFTFAHCAVFAWFCDLTLHIGQVDLTIMRYARSPTMGWASIGGMVLGHYITWIIAGVMYAVQLQADPALTSVAPGPIADRIAGVFGVIAVIIAGFSTASPVLYAGSLAAQHAFPRAPLWKVTLVVGGLASVAALFPALVARMLELLGICGLLLMPLGVILFVDFWILPRLGIASEVAHAQGGKTNVAAAAAWAATSTICLPIALFTPADVFFTPLLGIPLAGGLYVALSLAVNRKHTVEAQSSRQRPK